MPDKPQPKKRSWVPEKVQHQRSVDNSWFYNTWAWKKFRKGYVQRHPICIECDREGIVGPTEVCDHKEQFAPGAAGWDLKALKDEDYNPLCDHHHNSRSGKQAHGK